MAYEDQHVFAVWSPNMATAIMALNKTSGAHLLLQIVPAAGRPGYWLVFKADSWLRQKWRESFPDAEILDPLPT